MAFTLVCTTSDIAAGEARRIDHEEPVALFNVDGTFLAVQDKCTHGDWSLAEGYVDGDVVECTLHMAKFCLRTGKVLGPPATRPLKVYPVRVEGNNVLVDLSAGASVI
ncbi:MAG: bifunctional 3-phenylpropionate/cinnamic acid dioxygenase ferredoxin subunit [Rhizomicrobium sp.]